MTEDEFSKLTDTGKFRAVTELEIRAEQAEGVINKAKRYVFGVAVLLFGADELVARVMKWAERRASDSE